MFCQLEILRPCFYHKPAHDDDEGGAGEDVPARHSLPGHYQRLQQCQVSFHNVNNVM